MSIARRVLLAASTSAWLRDRATRSRFVRRSVSRFMPGERFDAALAAGQEQRTRGIRAIFTHLGENLTRPDQAEAVTSHYLGVLDQLHQSALDAHISVKLTQLGLDFDAGLCLSCLHALVDRVDAYAASGQFLWLDMESSPYVDRTLDLFTRVTERSRNVGIALQAYLRRTSADLERLLPFAPAIRLVKGAYLEPLALALPKKSDVDEAYARLGDRLLTHAGYAGAPLVHIATHDARLVRRLDTLARARQVPEAALEFAMLYGIQPALQQQLAREGRRVRVLVAYGDHWFPWYMRRLAERPANLWFVAKNLAQS